LKSKPSKKPAAGSNQSHLLVASFFLALLIKPEDDGDMFF
jgi:hypothetical protein